MPRDADFLACPLDFRYGRDAMKRIFSERGKLERLLEVEASLAEAHAEVGNVPEEAAREIRGKATLDHVDPQRVAEIEADIKHDIMAMVKALAEQCEGEAGGYVHLGATSYDIVDTANALMFRDGLDRIEDGLDDLEAALADLAREHRDTVMLGRTHGQAATPVTFGLKMAVFLLEVRRHRERLGEARERVLVGKMAGATGTMAGFGDDGFAIEEAASEILDIGMEEGPTQIVQRDRYIELVGVLANIATSLEKFATEVRNLQRPELLEAAEGFDTESQVGSSTMAHKQNPVTCERISGLARIVRSNLDPAHANAIQWHERDLANSSSERFILPHTFVVTDEIVRSAAEVFENLRVFPENMEENLGEHPEVAAEAVMLALADAGVDRQEAHEVVRQASMDEAPFGDALRKESLVAGNLDEDELARVLDPANYTGEAGELVDRALERAGYA
jgi:adenylosuccinate lyase